MVQDAKAEVGFLPAAFLHVKKKSKKKFFDVEMALLPLWAVSASGAA
jgi:hypothetical protein